VLVVKRDDDGQIFLDSGDEELKKRPAFVLVAHFVFELR
jgi:hypothetical protein